MLGLKVFEYFGIGKILEYDKFYVLFYSLNCKNEMRILLIMKWIDNIMWYLKK